MPFGNRLSDAGTGCGCDILTWLLEEKEVETAMSWHYLIYFPHFGNDSLFLEVTVFTLIAYLSHICQWDLHSLLGPFTLLWDLCWRRNMCKRHYTSSVLCIWGGQAARTSVTTIIFQSFYEPWMCNFLRDQTQCSPKPEWLRYSPHLYTCHLTQGWGASSPLGLFWWTHSPIYT